MGATSTHGCILRQISIPTIHCLILAICCQRVCNRSARRREHRLPPARRFRSWSGENLQYNCSAKRTCEIELSPNVESIQMMPLRSAIGHSNITWCNVFSKFWMSAPSTAFTSTFIFFDIWGKKGSPSTATSMVAKSAVFDWICRIVKILPYWYLGRLSFAPTLLYSDDSGVLHLESYAFVNEDSGHDTLATSWTGSYSLEVCHPWNYFLLLEIINFL